MLGTLKLIVGMVGMATLGTLKLKRLKFGTE